MGRLRGAEKARGAVAQRILLLHGLCLGRLGDDFAAGEGIERFGDRIGTNRAQRGIFHQALHDDFLEPSRNCGVAVRHRHWRGREHTRANGLNRFGLEGTFAGEKFIEHAAE